MSLCQFFLYIVIVSFSKKQSKMMYDWCWTILLAEKPKWGKSQSFKFVLDYSICLRRYLKNLIYSLKNKTHNITDKFRFVQCDLFSKVNSVVESWQSKDAAFVVKCWFPRVCGIVQLMLDHLIYLWFQSINCFSFKFLFLELIYSMNKSFCPSVRMTS